MTTAKKPRKPAKSRAISMRITDRLAKSIAALARESGRPVASCCSDLLELGFACFSDDGIKRETIRRTMREFAKINEDRQSVNL